MSLVENVREALDKNRTLVKVELLHAELIRRVKAQPALLPHLLEALVSIVRDDTDSALRANALRLIEWIYQPEERILYNSMWVHFVVTDDYWQVRKMAARLIAPSLLKKNDLDKIIKHLSNEKHTQVLAELGKVLADSFLDVDGMTSVTRWFSVIGGALTDFQTGESIGKAFQAIVNQVPDIEQQLIFAETSPDMHDRWNAIHALSQRINDLNATHIDRFFAILQSKDITSEVRDEIYHIFRKVPELLQPQHIDYLIEILPQNIKTISILRRLTTQLSEKQIDTLIYIAEKHQNLKLRYGVYRLLERLAKQLSSQQIYRLLFLLEHDDHQSRQYLLECLTAAVSKLTLEHLQVIIKTILHDHQAKQDLHKQVFQILHKSKIKLPLNEIIGFVINNKYIENREIRVDVLELLEQFAGKLSQEGKQKLIQHAIDSNVVELHQRVAFILSSLKVTLIPSDFKVILTKILKSQSSAGVTGLLGLLRSSKGDLSASQVEFLMKTLETKDDRRLQHLILNILQIYARLLTSNHLDRLLLLLKFDGDTNCQQTALAILRIRAKSLTSENIDYLVALLDVGEALAGRLESRVVNLLRVCSDQLNADHVDRIFHLYLEATELDRRRELFNLLQIHTDLLNENQLDCLVDSLNDTPDHLPVRLLQRAIEKLTTDHIDQLMKIASLGSSTNQARQDAITLIGRHGSLDAVKVLSKIRKRERLFHPFSASDLEESAFEALYAIYLQHPDAFDQ